MSDLLKEMGINPKKVVPKKDVPKKNDKDKKYTLADESIKKLNANAEDNRNINEIFKKYHAKEAQKMFEKIERLNKIINDNPGMSSKKSEIINRLIELYNLK